jgi:hypothetical protein
VSYSDRNNFFTCCNIFGVFLLPFTQGVETTLPIDNAVAHNIADLAVAGVGRFSDIRLILDLFVATDLFRDMPAPAITDTRFHPSNETILNCLYRNLRNHAQV